MNIALSFLRLQNRLVGTVLPGYVGRRATRLFLTPRRVPERPWEQDMERLGERIQVNDTLSVLRWGQGGPKVLLVHGWESRATHMALLGQALVQAGFQVFAPDGPAHGKSAGTQASPVSFADAVVAVDKALGPFDALVGHSMGGSAAALALAEGVTVQRAVLISSPVAILQVLQGFARFIGLPRRARQVFIRGVEHAAGKPASAIDLGRLMPPMDLPGLVIHDRDDAEIPFAGSQALVSAWDSATLLPTEGLGHRRILRDERVAQAVVDSLSPLLARSAA